MGALPSGMHEGGWKTEVEPLLHLLDLKIGQSLFEFQSRALEKLDQWQPILRFHLPVITAQHPFVGKVKRLVFTSYAH